MTTFYLVRHGNNDFLGRGLAGRMPNLHLNLKGQSEADRIADFLKKKSISHIFSSPLERARETAEPLAQALDSQVLISSEIIEVEFGDWNGASLEDLRKTPEWNRFISTRSLVRIPNGEMIVETQARMVRFIHQTAQNLPDHQVALFSHADPIKAALMFFLGGSIDFFHRLEISPGSISTIVLGKEGVQILGVNYLP